MSFLNVYRVKISGARAKIIGTTQVSLSNGYFNPDTAFFIEGHRIIVTAAFVPEGRALIWQYPSGCNGQPRAKPQTAPHASPAPRSHSA
jgi:hypothetical protein